MVTDQAQRTYTYIYMMGNKAMSEYTDYIAHEGAAECKAARCEGCDHHFTLHLLTGGLCDDCGAVLMVLIGDTRSPLQLKQTPSPLNASMPYAGTME